MTLTAFTAQSFPLWDLVPAAVGAIIGALAAAIPAWLLAKHQSDQALRRDREQRVERQKALAFAALVKLQHITNSVISLSNHLKSCLEIRCNPEFSHMEPWQVLVPMSGFTDEGSIRFTSEEAAVFAAAGEVDFMQDMMLLALRHSASLAIFQEYCIKRDEFHKIGPKPDAFEGEIGSVLLTEAQVISYKPYTIPLNQRVVGLDDGLAEDVRLAVR